MIRPESWIEEFERRFDAINRELKANTDPQREGEILEALDQLEYEDGERYSRE